MGDEVLAAGSEGMEPDRRAAEDSDLRATASGEALSGKPPDEMSVAELGEEIVRMACHFQGLERELRELEAEYERLSGGEPPPRAGEPGYRSRSEPSRSSG